MTYSAILKSNSRKHNGDKNLLFDSTNTTQTVSRPEMFTPTEHQELELSNRLHEMRCQNK